ncbi:hypothetical protein JF66_11670 [Cryobacterium sp. MLB-32]|uniref:maleylpyruvate isomerase family mycothiol-dependent enzyme n=1 Tax=Cryobacterium sp. MLB-32 TaxID=1529318 RepID=UPI0004E67374|nr:maleylpyruvate isomerase family mycothiol-dependent enzyme [Cryobacterium sp. MLB-32]KFF59382.1 hypothetical protein JF66_11670 [Cryobacterium sp. MLB-32]
MSPDDMLQTVRAGTAFFENQLDAVSNEQLSGESLLPTWTRSHVAAHVGYNALAIARLVSWAETGIETPMYDSRQARETEIDTAAGWAPDTLRTLCSHSGMLLDSAWSHLPDDSWAWQVQTGQGRLVPASETIWMRTREVWLHAVDLNATATYGDIPAEVLDRVLRDVVGLWATRGEMAGLRLESVEGHIYGDRDAPDPHIVTGELPVLTQWACGRAGAATTSNRTESPTAPRWL